MTSFTGQKRCPRPKIDRRLSRGRRDAVAAEAHEKVKYAFVGLSGGAGATMLAFAFAEYLAGLQMTRRYEADEREARGYDCGRVAPRTFPGKRCAPGVCAAAVVEINDANRPACGFDYDRIGMDKHFEGREYISCYRLLSQGKSVRGLANFDGGVNWMLRVPGEEFERFEVVDFVRLIDNAAGNAVICDIKGTFGLSLVRDRDRIGELRKILEDMDRVCAIVDPLPSSMMADREKLELFKDYEAAGGDIVYIINKCNPGVNRREVKNFLKVRGAFELPYFAPADIYAAEYNCRTVWSAPEISRQLSDLFGKICVFHNFSTIL
ncbi:MAG: hypothetical protein LBO81_02230 [Clostridiales Family XIII bacterium]|nr:hypothetical protein [Clostridiales Family XIII bacterium]